MSWLTSLGSTFRWMRQARSMAVLLNQKHAEAGDAESQYALGERYHDGLGVARDPAMALQWFLRAAEKGHRKAQFAAGMMLFLGRGNPPDPAEAVKWLSLAAKSGEANADGSLEKLRARLPREVFQEGQRRAAGYQRTSSAP